MEGSIHVDAAPILEGLKKVSNYDAIELAVTQIRRPSAAGGFDLNPFNQDDDQFGVIAEIKNNVQLVGELIHQVIIGVERVAVEFGLLSSSESKLEAASVIVAGAIKLPVYLFFLNPAKKPLIRHFITAAVEILNKTVGRNWLEAEQPPAAS